MINLTQHQKRHTPLQKEMTLYLQECAESPPSVNPIHTAMLTIDATASSSNDEPVDKYLPEPQSCKAVLKLDNDVRNTWLHAIKMEVKNLIDHFIFILDKTPQKDELIISVKLVLKAKQKGMVPSAVATSAYCYSVVRTWVRILRESYLHLINYLFISLILRSLHH
jgi:hypothetical protein